MKLPKSVTRNIARAMLICFAPFAMFAPVAQAGMIGTDQIISSTQTQSDRAHLIESLSRADLADQLRSAGVDPVQLQDRVASLTDAEVAMALHMIVLVICGEMSKKNTIDGILEHKKMGYDYGRNI